jgi:hypothetical protein
LGFFPWASSLLKGLRLLFFGFLKNFDGFSYFISFRYVKKKANYVLFYVGLQLFKGLRLLFLQKVQGGMFIQGATSIPDSRVLL